MPGQEVKDTPREDSRVGYSSLKTQFPIMATTPQESARKEEQKKKAEDKQPAPALARGGILPLIFNIVQLFSSKFGGTQPDDPMSSLYAAPRIHAPSDSPVFTATKGQNVKFAEEITGSIKGVTNEDSYLFITENVSDGLSQKVKPEWHAFVVPKSDPTRQYEIAVTNIKDGPLNYGFDVTLGNGHLLSLSHISSLDGFKIRGMENPEIDKLVKQAGGGSLTFGSSIDSFQSEFTGDSWVIMKKDFASGRIERFTQDGKSNLGRYEIIQGDACTKDQLYSDRTLDTAWLFNGETERAPQSSSAKVPLPESMKEEIAEDIQRNNYQINVHEGGMQTRANEALNALMPDQATRAGVIVGVRQRNKVLAAELNAAVDAKRGLARLAPRTTLLRPH